MIARLFLLLLMALSVMAGALLLGPVELPLREVVLAMGGGGDPATRTIILDLRLPRVILAAQVGAGLAVSGAVFQALLRNPLAEPYVLGVSGGAALGAVTAIVLGVTIGSVVALPLSAFVGAVVAILLVLVMAGGRGRGFDTRILLLSGVVIGAFFNAIILLIINFADVETFRSALLWIMGSFSGATSAGVLAVSLFLWPAMLALLLLARPLNLLSVGEQSAFHLGVDVKKFRIVVYVVNSLLVGVCVSGAGAIGFVGLVVPHALRLVGGSDHRWLLPASAISGAIYLVAADTLARTAVAPTELPVGVVTAIIGVPVFLWLLLRSEGVR
ncbi:MAG: iron ABC transporter permease [Gemmatimonadota bacterium]